MTGKKFGWYCIKWPLMLIIFAPIVAALSIVRTIFLFFIYKPIVYFLETCGCKKTGEQSYSSSYIIQYDGGEENEGGDDEEEDMTKKLYLHIIRKVRVNNDDDDFESKIEETLDKV